MTLVSVLIISAIASVATVALVIAGVARVQTAGAHMYGVQALALAHGCAELGLDEIRRNASYTGSQTYDDIGAGECSFDVQSGGTVQAEGVVGPHTKRVEVTLASTSPITIEAWQEVADFVE